LAKKVPGKQKHIPQRTCIVCRQKYDKRRLTRIVSTAESGVVIDPTGKRNGRGAYLCDQVSCWEKAINQPDLLDQALKTKLTSPERAALAASMPGLAKVREN
jgi:predicted RNA-binding protein YlxR (DUF448 family)